MEIILSDTPVELGNAAGKAAASLIGNAIQDQGFANVILATGTSQFETINQLLKEDIDWEKVNVFHLDEYIGIPVTHPASFRKYLIERFINKVDKLGSFYLINGEGDPEEECKRLSEIIQQHPIDVALAGIGENGHLAFNDPPADFNTEEPYKVVNLDGPCRLQQMNEGWFKSLEDVPMQAISMTIRQIMKSKHIICSVPDQRKATAVRNCLEGEVTNMHPASILQEHASCHIYLDKESASMLATTV